MPIFPYAPLKILRKSGVHLNRNQRSRERDRYRKDRQPKQGLKSAVAHATVPPACATVIQKPSLKKVQSDDRKRDRYQKDRQQKQGLKSATVPSACATVIQKIIDQKGLNRQSHMRPRDRGAAHICDLNIDIIYTSLRTYAQFRYSQKPI